jgi:ubiquitin C-terminal hydrolase
VVSDQEYDNFNLRYAEFLAEGNLNKYGSIGPRPMFDSVCLIQRKYRSMSQQDAPELFRYFLEGLIHGEEQILKSQGKFVKNPPNIAYKLIQTPVERIFGNYQAHRVECLECDYKSWTFHFSIDINLDIYKDEDNKMLGMFVDEKAKAAKTVAAKEVQLIEKSEVGHFQLTPQLWDSQEDPAPYIDPLKDKLYCPIPNYRENQSSNVEPLQLTNLLDDYFHREILNDQENYYCCLKCRKNSENKTTSYWSKPAPKFITKTFFLYNPGPVLVIVLKRFKKTTSYSWMSSGGFTKIDTTVKFPFTLDMTKYFLKANNRKESFKYSLHGIVVHGGGLGGGHYTAYASTQWTARSAGSTRVTHT